MRSNGKKMEREWVPYENDLESDECEREEATEKKERREGSMKTISLRASMYLMSMKLLKTLQDF